MADIYLQCRCSENLFCARWRTRTSFNSWFDPPPLRTLRPARFCCSIDNRLAKLGEIKLFAFQVRFQSTATWHGSKPIANFKMMHYQSPLPSYFGFFGVGAPAGDIAPPVGAAAGIGAVGAAIIGGAPGPAGGAGKLAAPGAGFGRSGGFNERNCLIASPAQIVSMRSSPVPSVCAPGIRYFIRISSQTRRASSIRFFAFNNGTSEISASGPL